MVYAKLLCIDLARAGYTSLVADLLPLWLR
jgi:hypothetical protein